MYSKGLTYFMGSYLVRCTKWIGSKRTGENIAKFFQLRDVELSSSFRVAAFSEISISQCSLEKYTHKIVCES